MASASDFIGYLSSGAMAIYVFGEEKDSDEGYHGITFHKTYRRASSSLIIMMIIAS